MSIYPSLSLLCHSTLQTSSYKTFILPNLMQNLTFTRYINIFKTDRKNRRVQLTNELVPTRCSILSQWHWQLFRIIQFSVVRIWKIKVIKCFLVLNNTMEGVIFDVNYFIWDAVMLFLELYCQTLSFFMNRGKYLTNINFELF